MSPESPQSPDVKRFSRRIKELRSSIVQIKPAILASNTGTIYHPTAEREGDFQFSYWKKNVNLSYPDLKVSDRDNHQELSAMDQAMILYHFNTADGIALSDQWISFSELPDGRFYHQAFQGYTGQLLARTFQNDKDGFERASMHLSGRHYPLGNASFLFNILPRITLLVVHWLGDEDFPASFQILFNASASHYLVTDGYAILGSILTHQLIKAYQSTSAKSIHPEKKKDAP